MTTIIIKIQAYETPSTLSTTNLIFFSWSCRWERLTRTTQKRTLTSGAIIYTINPIIFIIFISEKGDCMTICQNENQRLVHPVGLLTEDRACLIVGGGKVAVRKALSLLNAGATVTVVCSDPGEEISNLAQSGRVTIRCRPFHDNDADNMFLAYAATDDQTVNMHVHDVCRDKGVLCAIVDHGWQDGDFISPAAFRKGGLTVSISTGGQSCRRARLVKQSLERHIAFTDTADLLVIGADQRQLNLDARAQRHLAGDRLKQTGEILMHVWGIHEFMLLNTCNRIELMAVAARDPCVGQIITQLMRFDDLPRENYYILRATEAFTHAANMTAGMFSQIPGENHITAQVKQALATATANGWAGALMQDWVGRMLQVSKEIRQATRPLLMDVGIEDVALNYLNAHCPSLAAKQVLVIGGGVVAAGLLERLGKRGIKVACCYHARPPALSGLPSNASPAMATLDKLPEMAALSSAILCATTSDSYVLTEAHGSDLRRGPVELVIDLSIPRNVSPQLKDMVPNANFADLDDLKHWHRREPAIMDRVMEISRGVVTTHMDQYERIIQSLQGWNAVK